MAESKIGSPVNKNLKVEVRAGRTNETSPMYRKETYRMEEDIDVKTAIRELKSPTFFDRAKEEFELLVDTIRPKKEYDYIGSPPKKEGGLRASIGRKLEKITSPRSHNHQD